jgi:hypothetical protein
MPEDSTYPAGVADLEENKINPSRAGCHVVERRPRENVARETGRAG